MAPPSFAGSEARRRKPGTATAAQVSAGAQVALLFVLACGGSLLLLFSAFVHRMSDPRPPLPDGSPSDPSDGTVLARALITVIAFALVTTVYTKLSTRLGANSIRLRTALIAFAPPLFAGVVVTGALVFQWQVDSVIGPFAVYAWLAAVALVPSTLTTTFLLHPATRRWFHDGGPSQKE